MLSSQAERNLRSVQNSVQVVLTVEVKRVEAVWRSNRSVGGRRRRAPASASSRKTWARCRDADPETREERDELMPSQGARKKGGGQAQLVRYLRESRNRPIWERSAQRSRDNDGGVTEGG
jgi:hypothetical protein